MDFMISCRKYFYFISALIFLLVGCGGGGSSSNNDTRTQSPSNITITELGLSRNVDENEMVTLSLNASGAGSNDLTFTWEVEFNSMPLAFEGQGTDTITFIAPEVDALGNVYVDVEIDAGDIFLIGPNRDSINISVNDLDRPDPNNLARRGSYSDLPQVERLNLERLDEGATYLFTNYNFESDIRLSDDFPSVDHHTSIRAIAYIVNTEGTSKASFCHSDVEIPIDGSDLEILNCEQTIAYFQEDDAIRVEARCDDTLRQAIELTKISDTIRSDFGSLSLDFETYNDLPETLDACGYMEVDEVVDTFEGEELSVSSTEIALATEYENEPLGFRFILDEQIWFGSYRIKTGLDDAQTGPTDLALYSTMLIGISGNSPIVDTFANRVFITDFEDTLIGGDFSATIPDDFGNEEDISGEFSIRFE